MGDPIYDSWEYLGTVVGGRRGVEKGPAGGGFGFFLQGGKRFLL